MRRVATGFYLATAERAGTRFGFLTAPAQTAQTLSLVEAWALTGCYVLLGAKPRLVAKARARLSEDDYERLAKHLRAQVPDSSTIIAFFDGARVRQWQVDARTVGKIRKVVRDALIRRPRLYLNIRENTAFAPPTDDALCFANESGDISLRPERGLAVPVDGGVRLGAGGIHEGAFVFTCSMSEAQLAGLKAGCAYFSGRKEGNSLKVTPKVFPLFRAENEPLPFRAVLDFLALADHDRSYFEARSARVRSHIVTGQGVRLDLRPLEDGRLVFNPYADLPSSGARRPFEPDGYTLIPKGRFALLAPEGSGMRESTTLVCGRSGTEYFRVDVASSPANLAGATVLEFETGHRALVTRPIDSEGDEGDLSSLVDDLTTSWVKVCSPSRSRTIQYFTQPSSAPLHAPQSATRPEGPEVFPFSETAIGPHLEAVPFAPAGGLAGDDRVALAWEARVLAPTRRAAHPRRLARDTLSTRATTPHGLIFDASTKGGGTLVLATSEVRGDPTLPEAKALELRIAGMISGLTDALLRENVFAVVPLDEDTAFDMEASQLRIAVAGWHINLGAARRRRPTKRGAPATRPLLVIKFYDGASIAKLVEHPNLWSFPADPRSVTPSLAAYVKKTREAAKTQSALYGDIAAALDCPTWNGLLVLDCPIEPAFLPSDLVGITAGIALEQLRAHHLAIKVSDVERDVSGRLCLETTSIDGLIDYERPPGPSRVEASADDAFTFEVLELKVLFHNSEIKLFSCLIELGILKLFYDRTRDKDGNAPKPLQLHGRYESRDDGHGKHGVYVFSEETTRQIEIKSRVIKRLDLRKIQFTTVSAIPRGNDTYEFTSRFSISGDVVFGTLTDLDVFSFDELTLDDLGVEMTSVIAGGHPQGKTDLQLDVGLVRLVTSTPRESSLAKRLPIKLKSLLFAKEEAARPLSDLGFFAINLDGAEATDFHFALSFDFDLGALGALVSAAKGLKVEILIGWRKSTAKPNEEPDNRFILGIRLPESSGGRKEIGIEGIFKLIVEDFAFTKEDRITALKLVDTTLEILGARVPKLHIAIFADTSPGSKFEMDKVAWYVALAEPVDLGGLAKMTKLALGQRINVIPDASSLTKCTQVVEHLDDFKAAGTPNLKGLAQHYDPNGGWLLAFQIDLTFLGKSRLDFVVYDGRFYCVHLVVQLEEKALVDIDIAYRKIDDGLGVFSVDLAVPASWRRMEFGAVAITLPNLGLSLFTNGDFKVDLGFPVGLDFARSFHIEALPFVGAGGLYVAKLSGRTSDLLPVTGLKTVLQAGIALRFGLGKTFEAGLLRAGLSVTVFGILEGALGYAEHKLDLVKPSRFAIQGRVGVIGEIYGTVHFGIVSASVSIVLTAEVGFRIATKEAIRLWVAASVSVGVEIVLASFRIFGKQITIKISFSFRTEVRFDWTIGTDARAPIGGRMRALPAPLSTAPNWALPTFELPKAPLKLTFLGDATLVAAGTGYTPAIVVMLSLERPPADAKEGKLPSADTPFERLAFAVLSWALEASPAPPSKNRKRDGETKVDVARINALIEALRIPPTLATKIGDAKPLDSAAIAAFLDKYFDVTIVSPAKDERGEREPSLSTYFPMLPDTRLTIRGASPAARVIDYGAEERKLYGLGYQQKLAKTFAKLLADSRRENASAAAEPDAKTFAEVMLQDWFELLLKEVVEQARHVFVDAPEALTRQELHAALRSRTAKRRSTTKDQTESVEIRGYAIVAGALGRFFLHGLRVPDATDNDVTKALFDTAEQQFDLFPDGVPAKLLRAIELELASRDGATLPIRFPQNGAARLELSEPNGGADGLRRLAESSPQPEFDPPRQTSPLRVSTRTYSIANGIAWERAGMSTRRLHAFPETLTRALRGAGESQLVDQALRMRVCNANERHDTDEPRVWTRCTRIVVALRRVTATPPKRSKGKGARPAAPTDAFVTGAYRLERRDDQRTLLEQLRDSKEVGDVEIHLLYAGARKANARDEVPPKLTSSDTARNGTFLVRADVSEAAHPNARSGARTIGTAGVAARMDDEPAAFIRLLCEHAKVGGDGYFVHSPDADLARAFTKEDDALSVTFLVFSKESAAVHPGRAFDTDALVDESTLALEGETSTPIVYLEAPGLLDYDAAIEAGCVGIELVRKAPGTRYKTPAAIAEYAHVAGRFEREAIVAAMKAERIDSLKARDVLLHEAGESNVRAETLYNLVEYSWDATRSFAGLPPDASLPSGPTSREQLDPNAHWRYEQTFPLYRFAFANEGALKTCAHGKPCTPMTCAPPRRYLGMGETVNVHVAFRDAFGNQIAPAGGEPLPIKLQYADAIIGVGEWPGTTTSFSLSARSTITLTLTFDATSYAALIAAAPCPSTELCAPTPEGAKNPVCAAIDRYQRVRDQLLDEHLTVFLESTLEAKKEIVFPAASKRLLIEYVEAVLGFLGGSGSAPAARPFSFGVTPGTESCIELEVALGFRRREDLVEPEAAVKFRRAAEVKSTAVPPEADDLTTSLASFFPDYRLAAAVASTEQRAPWVVRHAAFRDLALGAPTYFAPKPLALKPVSAARVEVPVYAGAEVTTKMEDVVDADLDAYARSFFIALERFLAPEYLVPARRIIAESSEAGTGVGKVDALVERKADLATTYGGRLAPFYQDEPIVALETTGLGEAIEAFRERLCVDLRAAYDVDCIVQLKLSGATWSGKVHPKLYGTMEDAGGASREFQTVPARVPLTDGKRLTFLVDGDSERRAAKLLSRPLVFRVTHLESEDEASTLPRWLRLSTTKRHRPESGAPPDDSVNVRVAALDIPLPLRRLPQAPRLTKHSWSQTPVPSTGTEGDRLEASRGWTYTVEYLSEAIPNDTVRGEVGYNSLTAGAPSLLANEANLLRALFRFARAEEQLRPLLSRLPITTGPAPAELVSAILAFCQEVTLAARAFSTHSRMEAPPGARLTDKFSVLEVESGSGLQPKLDHELPKVGAIKIDALSEADGWLARRVTVTKLDLLRTEDAWAEMFLTRNDNLITPIRKKVDPAFVYTTIPTRFGSPVAPCLTRNETFYANKLAGAGPTLCEQIRTLLEAMTIKEGRPIVVHVSYVCDAAHSEERTGVRIKTPCVLLARTRIDATGVAPIAKVIADGLEVWLNKELPSIDGELELAVTVMSNGTSPRVIGRWLDIRIPLRAVAMPAGRPPRIQRERVKKRASKRQR